MPQRMILFFVSIAFSFIPWGMVHRVGSLGSRGRVPRFAACLRAWRGLRGRHCDSTCLAFATIAAQRGWRRRRMDLQPVEFRGSS